MNERVTRHTSEPSGRSRPTLRPQVRIMARIKRLSYRTGFVERLAEAALLPHLPAITFEAADLPDDVVALVDAHLLDLGATYGDPEAGDAIQYDELRSEHDQGARSRSSSTTAPS